MGSTRGKINLLSLAATLVFSTAALAHHDKQAVSMNVAGPTAEFISQAEAANLLRQGVSYETALVNLQHESGKHQIIYGHSVLTHDSAESGKVYQAYFYSFNEVFGLLEAPVELHDGHVVKVGTVTFNRLQ